MTAVTSATGSKNRWLSEYSADVTSQCGEDGIIAKCLDLLPQTDGWCVEFGAYDGKTMSNTYNLIANRGYRAVLIEPDEANFKKLDTAFPFRERIVAIKAFVGFTEQDGLDEILSRVPIPVDFDLLSIDVDGNDYHVWDAIRRYKPKLVVIEYNFTMANSVLFVQQKSWSVRHGTSASALVALGKSKGYELVAVTPVNLVFVDARYFDRFDIADNSLEAMRDDSACPHIFVTYDGCVRLFSGRTVGKIQLPWHGIELLEKSIQPLPRFLRSFPGDYTRWQRVAYVLRYPLSYNRPQRLWTALKSTALRAFSGRARAMLRSEGAEGALREPGGSQDGPTVGRWSSG